MTGIPEFIFSFQQKLKKRVKFSSLLCQKGVKHLFECQPHTVYINLECNNFTDCFMYISVIFPSS